MGESSRAVFLSYASQDAEAARSICETLRVAGIEVWFDQSDLRGGDAWDQKIRSQIKDCALFIAIISAHSQSRLEGYFRREWKLAADRTHDMADGEPFLVPVVIDDTKEANARVPESFRAVQWTRLPAGATTAAFADRISGLLARGREGHRSPDSLPVTGTLSTPAPLRKISRRANTPALWLVGLIAAAMLLSGGYFLTRHTTPVSTVLGNDSGPSAPIDVTARPRIAVLPFENLSPDPNNAFFTDGMHEEVLTALANGVPGLDVISRMTMDTYKGKAVTAQTLAKELHCNYVLQGSMRREGNQMRLALQLIDARSDSHVWAKDFDRKLVNIMALESEVAAAVAAQLSIKLEIGEPAQIRGTDPVAFDLYLKARAAQNNTNPGSSSGDWQNILSQLDQALRLDPSFVRAYVDRIGVRVSLFTFNHDLRGAGLATAHTDLEVAKRLAPQDPVVIAAEALLTYAEKDYARSLRLFQAAESAGLADSRMLDWKGTLLFAMGRYQEAAALNQRLMDLDPNNFIPCYELWFAQMELHQPKEAMRVAGLIPQKEYREASRNTVRWTFGGDRLAFEAAQKSTILSPLDTADHTDVNLLNVVASLEYLARYGEARQIIDKAKVETIRQLGSYWPTYRIGRTPVADMRGWLDLFLADAPAAQRDGKRILEFLGSEAETRWNSWFRTLLLADAQLFMGDRATAIITVDRAVSLTREEQDVSDQMNASVWATQIRAWAGAQNEAVVRLETLSTAIPGLWPGEIVLDPLWSVPLGRNDGYTHLASRLGEQMKPVTF